jgi:cytidylate kinase
MTIAIDGPAGSGKSTVGSRVAQRLDYIFIDTGLLYRAITGIALLQGVNIYSEDAVAALLPDLHLDVHRNGSAVPEIRINGQPLPFDLHSDAINHAVAILAPFPRVRQVVRRTQAEIAQQGRVVFAGRDIGTVVLPHADLKIFLTVGLEERARRRYLELSQTRSDITLDAVLDDLTTRDQLDSTRAESPLRMGSDAVLIEADHLGIDAVVDRIVDYALNCSK